MQNPILSSAMHALTFALALLATGTYAQTPAAAHYPNKPVRAIVPYPAGGPTDQVARQIAPKMAAKLGQRERELVATNHRLTVMASMDLLSGLANRRGFQSRLDFEWMKALQSGSSFYYSFLFLEPERRRAITALYAFCREVDDAVDEPSDPQVARSKLAWWRAELANLFAGRPQHPVTQALAPALAPFRLTEERLGEIVASRKSQWLSDQNAAMSSSAATTRGT